MHRKTRTACYTPHLMKIAVFVAGTNTPSNAELLADTFIEGLKQINGTAVEKFHLRDLSINHFTLSYYTPKCSTEDDFCKIQEAVERAHGIVIATPIWNFSVPGHLKNFIDRIGAFALDAETHSQGMFHGKPFYLIFTGGAPMIAWKAIMHVTTAHIPEAIKYYGGTVVGRYFEPRCMPRQGEFGLVVDQRPATIARMKKKGERFALLVKRYAETGSLPWRHRSQHAFRRWANAVANRMMYQLKPYG